MLLAQQVRRSDSALFASMPLHLSAQSLRCTSCGCPLRGLLCAAGGGLAAGSDALMGLASHIKSYLFFLPRSFPPRDSIPLSLSRFLTLSPPPLASASHPPPPSHHCHTSPPCDRLSERVSRRQSVVPRKQSRKTHLWPQCRRPVLCWWRSLPLGPLSPSPNSTRRRRPPPRRPSHNPPCIPASRTMHVTAITAARHRKDAGIRVNHQLFCIGILLKFSVVCFFC